MQKTPRRRVLCALAAGAFVAGSGLALISPMPASATTAVPVLAHGCEGVEVRLLGEAVVGATLSATASGGPFDGAAVRFEWLVQQEQEQEQEQGPDSTPLPTPTPQTLLEPEPEPTPTPTPTLPPEPIPPARGEYVVRGADVGRVVRARAVLTEADGGAPLLACLSPASAVVLAGNVPEQGEPPTPAVPPAVQPAVPDAEPAAVRGIDQGEGWGDSRAEPVAEVVPEAPAAASAPVVSVAISEEVLLIGGLGALAVMAGLLMFGRNEN